MNQIVFVHMVRALNPLQSVRITFAKGSDGLRVLSVLDSRAVIEDQSLAKIVLGTQGWPNVPRVLTARLNPFLLQINGIYELAARGIEDIHVVSTSPLNALQTSRAKKQQEAYHQIVNAVATKELRDEIESYGLELLTEKEEFLDFFNFITFSIKNGNKIDEILLLDGWTGNVCNGHRSPIYFCSDFSIAQKQLQHEFNLYLERETEAA